MKKTTILLFLIIFQFVSSQENKEKNNSITTYKYGHNGMEYIVTFNKETIVVSTFNSKKDIKSEIAQKIYTFYKNNKEIKTLNLLTINGDVAKVTGKYIVIKKGKLIAVNFYYKKIEWNNGLIEFYKKNIG
ncbi:MAG: hypothetical protein WCJ62_10885 [Flavobacterium sp.]